MKTIEDLRSEVRCQALVLVGYSIAKDDDFLSDMAQILMSIAAPSDEDAEELAEAYENMRDYFSKDAAPDLTTQEPQENGAPIETYFLPESPVAPVQFHICQGVKLINAYTLDEYDQYVDDCAVYGLTALPLSLADKPEIIDATEEVTDEAVEASGEGGRLASRVDALNAATLQTPHGEILVARADPDFGPRKS